MPARLAGVTVNTEEPEVVRHAARRARVQAEVRCRGDIRARRLLRATARSIPALRRRGSRNRRLAACRRRPADAVACRAARSNATRPPEIEPWLTNADFRRFKWWREAEREFQPFHQRIVLRCQPDLSFTSLNGDRPLNTSPYHPEGVLERMQLIRDKMPGVEELILRPPPAGAAQIHVIQACALVWTARRCRGTSNEPVADGRRLGRDRHAHGARALSASGGEDTPGGAGIAPGRGRRAWEIRPGAAGSPPDAGAWAAGIRLGLPHRGPVRGLGRGITPGGAGYRARSGPRARDYAWGCRESRPVWGLGRGNTPGGAEIAPGLGPWAREYAWGCRNRARSAPWRESLEAGTRPVRPWRGIEGLNARGRPKQRHRPTHLSGWSRSLARHDRVQNERSRAQRARLLNCSVGG